MPTSVIVLHYGSQQLTQQCLESVVRHSPDVEIVLVDNAGDWGFDSPRPKDFGYIKPTENLGFAAGCNEGSQYAHGDTLIFLNNDTRVRELWLEPLVYELNDPTVGAAGPMLVYPDNRIQCAGIGINWSRPLGQEAFNRQTFVETPHDVPAITGACMAIRADVFNEVGGFDTGYWNGYEDVDLCLKLTAAGYRIVNTPHSQVVHYESQSNPEERFRKVRENVLRLRGRWDPAWLTSIRPT